MFKSSFGLYFILSIVIVSLFSSCETEVDLLAPYEQTPVIYGILDYTADTQFVRINKTYIGPGEPSQYSAIKDSVEYDLDDVVAVINKYNNNGTLLSTFSLETIEIPNRDPGIFYDEDVLFYYTDIPLLTPDQEDNQEDFLFELVATIKGEEYRAETRFPGLSASTIQTPTEINGNPQKLRFTLANGTFASQRLEFTTDAFTASYSTAFRMNFDYITNDGILVENQIIDYNTGDFTNVELSSGQQITITVNGENYYTFLGNQLDLFPGLAEVQIEDFEFRVLGTTPELSRYLDVAQPVSQFTPVLNSYTNLSNGAIGIFSSLGLQTQPAWIEDRSIEKFSETPLTNSYSYCVQGWIGSNQLCPE